MGDAAGREPSRDLPGLSGGFRPQAMIDSQGKDLSAAGAGPAM